MPNFSFSIIKSDTGTNISTFTAGQEYYTTQNVTTSAEEFIERFITKACLSSMPILTLRATVTAFEAV